MPGLAPIGLNVRHPHRIGQQVQAVLWDAGPGQDAVVPIVEHCVVDVRGLRVGPSHAGRLGLERSHTAPQPLVVFRTAVFGKIVHVQHQSEAATGQLADQVWHGRVLAQAVVVDVDDRFVGGQALLSEQFGRFLRQPAALFRGGQFFIVQPGQRGPLQDDSFQLFGQFPGPAQGTRTGENKHIQRAGEHPIQRPQMVGDDLGNSSAVQVVVDQNQLHCALRTKGGEDSGANAPAGETHRAAGQGNLSLAAPANRCQQATEGGRNRLNLPLGGVPDRPPAASRWPGAIAGPAETASGFDRA